MADIVGTTVQAGQEIDNDGIEIVENPVDSSATDAKLSEEQKFKLFKKLEEFPCLWNTSICAYKDKAKRQKATDELCQMFSIIPASLKRVLHSTRTALMREIKKEQEGNKTKSKWKFMEALSFMKAEILQSAKAKEEKEWSDKENEILIQFYKENEALWNHKLSSYKDRNLKEYNYQSLVDNLPGRDQSEIKKQWHVLKTIYYRELKREEGSKVSGTGTESVYNSKWKFFHEMSFVRGSDDVDPPVTSMDTTDQPYSAIQPSKRLKADKARTMEEAKLAFYKEAITCLKAPLPSVNMEQCPKPLDDEITLYCKSLEATLRKFSQHQFIFAKKKINDLLFEVELECYHEA